VNVALKIAATTLDCADIRYAARHPLRQRLPFASPNGLFSLSKLSVWWLRLGIQIAANSRSKALNASSCLHGLAQQRIKPGHPHRTVAMSACISHSGDHFIDEFDRERRHEASGMKRPADPASACIVRRSTFSTVLADQTLGIKEVMTAFGG
jgi:hypothetical protein